MLVSSHILPITRIHNSNLTAPAVAASAVAAPAMAAPVMAAPAVAAPAVAAGAAAIAVHLRPAQSFQLQSHHRPDRPINPERDFRPALIIIAVWLTGLFCCC